MTAYLFRVRISSLCTIGIMIAGSSIYWTLEPPWKDNKRNVSCIPRGEYNCVYLPRSASGKYKNVYHVTGVEGRSGILIHNGNLPNHTLGCILLGKRTGKLSGSTAVLNSRTAMIEFVRKMNKQPFRLKVTQWG